jgi:SAM-dependent methyltransferase
MRFVDRALSRLASRVAKEEALVWSPYVSAKLFPLQREESFSLGASGLVQPLAELPAAGPLPVPPPDLWEGWADTEDVYLSTGRNDMRFVLDALERAGELPEGFARVLDFGSAAGRMLRFYPAQPGSERWGVDIKAKHIAWAQQHLSPPYSFALTTTFPHLPFEDCSFDLVYCLSVFTHMVELADAWFLELRRVVRPGGYVFVTIHDERSVELLPERYPDGELTTLVRRLDAETGAFSKPYAVVSTGTEPGTQVFYRREYLLRKWEQLAELVSVIEEPARYQTALLFRKRSRARER